MKNNAFTLIELLIVIAITAIIAGAMILLFSVSKQDAKIAKFLALVDALRIACEQYYFDIGEYAIEQWDGAPDDRRLSFDPNIITPNTAPGWNGPYISHPLTEDDNPFGRDITAAGDMGVSFDLNGDGSIDLEECQVLSFDVKSDDAIAEKIDDAVDKGLGGAEGWKAKGKVVYDSSQPYEQVCIYLLGGKPPS